MKIKTVGLKKPGKSRVGVDIYLLGKFIHDVHRKDKPQKKTLSQTSKNMKKILYANGQRQ